MTAYPRRRHKQNKKKERKNRGEKERWFVMYERRSRFPSTDTTDATRTLRMRVGARARALVVNHRRKSFAPVSLGMTEVMDRLLAKSEKRPARDCGKSMRRAIFVAGFSQDRQSVRSG